MLSSPPPPSSTHCPMALVPTESARRPGQQGRPRGWLPGQRSRVCFQMCCLVTHLGSGTLPELTLPGHTQKRAVGRVSECLRVAFRTEGSPNTWTADGHTTQTWGLLGHDLRGGALTKTLHATWYNVCAESTGQTEHFRTPGQHMGRRNAAACSSPQNGGRGKSLSLEREVLAVHVSDLRLAVNGKKGV